VATYEITGPNGEVFEVEGPDDADPSTVIAQITGQQAAPPQEPSAAPSSPLASAAKNLLGYQVEPALQMATGIVSAPAAGLAGIAGTLLPGEQGQGARWTENVQNALTYQPRTEGGKLGASIVNYPFEKLAQGADYLGGGAAELTGSPAVGATVNTAIQAAPSILLKGRGGARTKARPGETPRRAEPTITEPPEVVRAKEYVARNTALDWNALSDSVRARITNIAKDARALERMDPKAIERQAGLESLPVPVPATRGQLTRDPVQLRNEGNVASTEAGKPVREIHVAQNRALIENLEVLKGKVGKGRAAETAEQLGESVQGAARAKLEAKKKEVSDLYKKAESQGELQGEVSPQTLIEVIESTPDATHFGWVDSWLKKADVRKSETTDGITVESSRNITLKEFEDLRQAAVARAMNGGTEGYYAGKVIRAIDEATEGAGGTAYQAARKARREQALEFEDQGAVEGLVSNKTRTDRSVALEDTWRKTVLGGSIDDLRKVKRSLLTGGTKQTQIAGRNAWRDIRAETISHIIREATKNVSRFEDGSLNVTPAAMERAIRSVGPAKLNEIFGPETVKQLNKIMEATRTVKTEPPPSFRGSPTFANAIAFLEKTIGRIPGGDFITGAVRGAANLRELGRTGREVREAQRTPLDEGAQAVQSNRRRNTLIDALPYALPTQRERRR
jgi:hypothetical protein